ncbi:MAG: hypothetical protein QM780_05740 [Hyphomicrobium sp.]|uniref:hypothetical protein n=1 Tax=Hyphomicrobium sp. TaxID=82 RepID=UPI0039E21684
MKRLAIIPFAIGLTALALAAAAQDQPKPLLTEQQINDIIARLNNKKVAKPTSLCGLSGLPSSCGVFALPNSSLVKPTFSDPFLSKPATPLATPVLPTPPPRPLTVACPKDDHFHSCRLIENLTDVGPGQVGATLYLGGSHSAELSRKAAQGILTSGEVKALISEKTIGLLPQAVETSAADRAVGVLAKSGIAKAGRGAAVVGVALMTYAAYEYFFGGDDAPTEKKPLDKQADH